MNRKDEQAQGSELSERLGRAVEELEGIVGFPPEGYKRRTEEGYPMECVYDQFAYERMVDSYRDAIREVINHIKERAG